ncbi:MAG: DUF5610 domain-containing protein [Candidatus Hydrogenedentes bacterium]|nr:DUF5610 domain-containing protein [Candidatus Hydrogenedentota bacterium]
MATNIPPITPQPVLYQDPLSKPKAQQKGQSTTQTDSVSFGSNSQVTPAQANSILLERAYDKIRSVVSDAKAALGIPEGQAIDTSNEATAGRIADFALGAFEKWRSTPARAALSDEEARKQFATFIGGAISQGISEAQNILGALNALNPEITNNIQSISDLIQQRLDSFVANGK